MAVPSARATAVSSLRRGCRAKESLRMRQNTECVRLLRNFARGVGEGRKIDHQLLPSTCDGTATGLQPPGLADAGHVDRRSAVAANHVGSVLPVARPSADHASVQRRAPTAVGLANDDEAQRGVVHFDLEKMQIAVAHIRRRYVHRAVLRRAPSAPAEARPIRARRRNRRSASGSRSRNTTAAANIQRLCLRRSQRMRRRSASFAAFRCRRDAAWSAIREESARPPRPE